MGYWLLAMGYWLLAIGCPSGYWILAIGYWQLVIDSSYLAFARTITRRARVRQLTIDSYQLSLQTLPASTMLVRAEVV